MKSRASSSRRLAATRFAQELQTRWCRCRDQPSLCFSFQLGTTLHDRCALVEAPVVFSLFERLGFEISLVIDGCNVTRRIVRLA
jgi:hypothetical protein